MSTLPSKDVTPGQVKFRAVIRLSGKTATGISVPPNVVEKLGSGKRPAVRATIIKPGAGGSGYTYRSSVASLSGEFMLSVSAEVREQAGIAAGDEVDVFLELDTQPREVSIPPDFAAALEHDTKAGRFFEGLSYSNKQRHVLSIQGAKTPETRQRRIEKAISLLRQGKA